MEDELHNGDTIRFNEYGDGGIRIHFTRYGTGTRVKLSLIPEIGKLVKYHDRLGQPISLSEEDVERLPEYVSFKLRYRDF